MKSCLLLLLLPLITGVGAIMKIEACYDHWVEFTCSYPEARSTFPWIPFPMFPWTGKVPMSPIIQLDDNWWVDKADGVSLFHAKGTSTIRVSIKHLTLQHVGEYMGGQHGNDEGEGEEKEKKGDDGNSGNDDNVGKIIIEGQDCQEKPFTQVSYLTAPITLTCRYHNTNGNIMFLCKDNIFTCVEIVSTQSHLSPDGQFSLKLTDGGFNVTIVNVTEKHNGTYRCGLKSGQGSRKAVKQIDLRTENITKLDLHKPAREAFTFLCPGASMDTVICKGEDPSTCKTLFNASKSMSERIVIISDNKNRKNLTVMDPRESDSGTYWCGSKSSNPHESNRFHLRMKLTVVSVPMVTSPALVSPASPSTGQGSLKLSLIISAACLAVLLLALVVALIYRKKTRHGEVENVMEDPFYAEIQDPPQKSADALKTIYTTATLPFRPPCNGSAEVETRCHDYSTISHPIKTPQEQFYSTASAPQQL